MQVAKEAKKGSGAKMSLSKMASLGVCLGILTRYRNCIRIGRKIINGNQIWLDLGTGIQWQRQLCSGASLTRTSARIARFSPPISTAKPGDNRVDACTQEHNCLRPGG